MLYSVNSIFTTRCKIKSLKITYEKGKPMSRPVRFYQDKTRTVIKKNPHKIYQAMQKGEAYQFIKNKSKNPA